MSASLKFIKPLLSKIDEAFPIFLLPLYAARVGYQHIHERPSKGKHSITLVTLLARSALALKRSGLLRSSALCARYAHYLNPEDIETIFAASLLVNNARMSAQATERLTHVEEVPKIILQKILLLGQYHRDSEKEVFDSLQVYLEQSPAFFEQYSGFIFESLMHAREVKYARLFCQHLLHAIPSSPYIRTLVIEFYYQKGYLSEALSLFASFQSDPPPIAVKVKDCIDKELAFYAACREMQLREKGNSLRIDTRKVVYVAGSALPQQRSGYTYRTHRLAQAHVHAGREIIVAVAPATSPHNELIQQSNIGGVKYFRLGSHQGLSAGTDYLKSYRARLLELVNNQQPTAIHAASYYINGIVAGSVADATGLPFIYELRGLWEDTLVAEGKVGEDSDRYIHHRNMEMYCMNKADQVVTLSETQRKDLISRGITPDKITVIPNGFSTEASAEVTSIERTPPIFGYIGSMTFYEGLDLAVKAISEIESARLILVGDGEEKPKLEILAKSLDLGERVTFTGRVAPDEVDKYFAEIDVFVLPRRPCRVCNIVSPIKPFEAFAAGKLVLAADLPVMRELLADGARGELFKAGSLASLVEKIKEIIATPERYKTKCQRAHEWALKERSWTKLLEEEGRGK